MQLNSGAVLGAFVQHLITVGFVAHSVCNTDTVADSLFFLYSLLFISSCLTG